jgi:hypothetical protein
MLALLKECARQAGGASFCCCSLSLSPSPPCTGNAQASRLGSLATGEHEMGWR